MDQGVQENQSMEQPLMVSVLISLTIIALMQLHDVALQSAAAVIIFCSAT